MHGSWAPYFMQPQGSIVLNFVLKLINSGFGQTVDDNKVNRDAVAQRESHYFWRNCFSLSCLFYSCVLGLLDFGIILMLLGGMFAHWWSRNCCKVYCAKKKE